LFGVKIPLNKTIEATNEKSVGLNTIGDALMSSVGGGCACCCIDEQNKRENKAGLKLIKKLLTKKSAKINNLDITVVCNNFNICEYSILMKEEIATQLNISKDSINIKSSGTGNVLLDSFKNSDKLLISVVVCTKMN